MISKRKQSIAHIMLCGAVAMGTIVAGSTAANAAPPRQISAAVGPVNELQPLVPFVGTWRCEGTFTWPGGTPQAASSVSTAAFELGGSWLSWKIVNPAAGPDPASVAYWGWDPAERKFVLNTFSSGGIQSRELSNGWNDNVFSAEGSAQLPDGTKLPSRATYVTVSDTSLESSGEYQFNGEWTKVYVATCNR